MDMKLSQRKNFESRNFELDSQKLKVEYNSWKEEKAWEIRLDKIGFQKYYKKESIKPRILTLILIGLFFIFINLFGLLSTVQQNWGGIILGDIFMLFICCLIYFKKPQNEIILIGGEQDVSFFGDIPDTKTVEKYIDEVIKNSSRYILFKYGKIDADLPEDTQMNILYWLKNRELISDYEYEDLKKEYKTNRLL
jgi:hypothetical protein